MKQLKDICEGVFDVDDNIENMGESLKKDIADFIENTYANTVGKVKYDISKEPNKDGKFEVELWGDVYVKNGSIEHLTNGRFIFTTCYGTFDCSDCDIESLEGCPQWVKNFLCSGCNFIKDLKGGPQTVRGSYTCDSCNTLKNLEGSPREVMNFTCSECSILSDLKGAPKIVKGNFHARDCGTKFIANDVAKVSKVHGNILVK